METHEAVMRGLDGKKKKGPTHAHGVHYERADNGGYVAHVHMHHGKGPRSEGHSHTEEKSGAPPEPKDLEAMVSVSMISSNARKRKNQRPPLSSAWGAHLDILPLHSRRRHSPR